jgi:hypothetical protein
MAAKTNQTSPERSRVRFIMVDFDGTSSDMHQLAQTFAAAVKAPTQNFVMMSPANRNGMTPPIQLAEAPLNGSGDAPETPSDEEVVQLLTPPPALKPQGNPGKRKLRTPVMVSALEFTGGPVPFKAYCEDQAPEEHSKRYLVCAQWLKEYRNIVEVSADHIYTCYRAVGMNVPADVLCTLRGLKKQGWVQNGSKRGLFRITHVGEGQLKKR